MPLSDAERQARRRAKQAHELDGLTATIAELTHEVDRLRREQPDRESRDRDAKATRESKYLWDRIAALEGANDKLANELQANAAAARVLSADLAKTITSLKGQLTQLQAKSKERPLSALEAELESLKAVNKKIKTENTRVKRDNDHLLRHRGAPMPAATYAMLVKTLHPDVRQQRNEADLDEALKHLTAWRQGLK